MLRTIATGIALTVPVLGAALAARADSVHPQRNSRPPAECIVPVAVAPGYLPRANLRVENRRATAIEVWLEARTGSGLPRTELARLGPFESRAFAHALPAGRNVLAADVGGEGAKLLHYVLIVHNRGPETCARHYLWRIE